MNIYISNPRLFTEMAQKDYRRHFYMKLNSLKSRKTIDVIFMEKYLFETLEKNYPRRFIETSKKL